MFSLVFLIDELFEILFYDGLHLLVRSCRSPRKRKRVRRKIQIKETCFAAELILFYSIAFNNVGNSLLKLSSTNRYIFISTCPKITWFRAFIGRKRNHPFNEYALHLSVAEPKRYHHSKLRNSSACVACSCRVT